MAGLSQDDIIGYDKLDPFKRECTMLGRLTNYLLLPQAREVAWSRGESCYVIDHGDFYTGHVIEGLGTKNRIGELMAMIARAYDGRDIHPLWARNVAIDCVAMIVNDMITLGIPPFQIAMHLAVGDSAWFDNQDRSALLAEGWQWACIQSDAVWGGGETPTLKEIIEPGTFELSGSATGILRDKRKLVNPERIRPGDVIIGLASNGIHANGLTKARELGMEFGFFNQHLSKGSDCYGDELMRETSIYVKFLRACQQAGIRWSYGINVTGHGWRKIMRAEQELTYRITAAPEWMPIFSFMSDVGQIDKREMYATFNMGIGFIVIVRKSNARKTMTLARGVGYEPMILGAVEEGPKRVIIEPHGIEYEGSELEVR